MCKENRLTLVLLTIVISQDAFVAESDGLGNIITSANGDV